MMLNRSICEFNCTLDNISLEPMKSFSDLGITFSSKLCFIIFIITNHNIERITIKVFLNLGSLHVPVKILHISFDSKLVYAFLI